MRWILFAALGLSMFSSASAAESPATADYLRCEYRVDPLGIDVVQPRLSWEMRDARRGAKQTAYQVLVASTPEKLAADEADLWDSGKVADRSIDPSRLCRQAAAIADALLLEGSAVGRRRETDRVTANRPCGRWAC